MVLSRSDEKYMTGIDENGKEHPLPSGSYKGPYLSVLGGLGCRLPDSKKTHFGVPVNPFIPLTNGDSSDIREHWQYRNGIVHPAGPEGKTLDGTPYTAL